MIAGFFKYVKILYVKLVIVIVSKFCIGYRI